MLTTLYETIKQYLVQCCLVQHWKKLSSYNVASYTVLRTTYNFDNIVQNHQTIPRTTLPRTTLPCTMLKKAVFVQRCFVHRASYNVEELSTLYEITSYKVDVVRGTTVYWMMKFGYSITSRTVIGVLLYFVKVIIISDYNWIFFRRLVGSLYNFYII